MRRPMRTAAVALVLGTVCPNLLAQIATDGTMGARGALSGPNYSILDTLGTRRGGNLFHSFSTFNLQNGETAIFSGSSPGILNIIARVTGGSRSEINGRLRSTVAGANLYFLNPYGIFFGPNATLDVTGSFYATTASYIRLSDGTRFDVSLAPGIGVSVASPEAFGFNGATAGITIAGSTLTVPAGRQIVLAGGDISIGAGTRAATIQAQGGRINLASIASAGELRYLEPALDVSPFSQLGNIDIRGGALVSVNESSQRVGGGTILVRANSFTLDHASLEARNRFVNGSGIDVYAPGRIEINGGNVIAVTTGTGNAGTINLTGGDIAIKDKALVDTSCDPGCTSGNGGPLNIFARNLSIEGTDPSVSTFVVSNSFGGGNTGAIRIEADTLNMSGNASMQAIGLAAGNSNGISLRTGNISITGGAQVEATSRGTGSGGNIVVSNNGAVRIDGIRIDPTRPGTVLPSGLVTNAGGTGNAGSIVVSTRTLEVLGGAEISSSSRGGATGAGGKITINASGGIVVAGTGSYDTVNSDGKPVVSIKASAIAANTFSSGSAGEIDLNADTIEIRDQARVQVLTELSPGNANTARIRARTLTLTSGGQISSDASIGNGGQIDIDVKDTISIDGIRSGIYANANGSGRGGTIKVHANRIDIDNRDVIYSGQNAQQDFSGIYSNARSSGDGGTVSVGADSQIRVANNGRISSQSSSTGLAGNVNVSSGGDVLVERGTLTTSTFHNTGGNVVVKAANRIVVDGGSIASNALLDGIGGNIDVAAREIDVINQGIITTTAKISDGGSITIQAADLLKIDGGSVESRSEGTGTGGFINVAAGNIDVSKGNITTSAVDGKGGNILASAAGVLSIGGSIESRSDGKGLAGNVSVSARDIDIAGGKITTSATFSDGGNISVKAGDRVFINGGSIETAVGSGLGNGGNIRMEQPLLLMRGGVISANAYGGAGGNIRIAANAVVKSSDSRITASSQLGVDGTVVVDSPIIDPSGELVVPAANYLVADAILASRCGPRLAGRASSLIVGEIGIPANTATQLQLPLDATVVPDTRRAQVGWDAAMAISRIAAGVAGECPAPVRPLLLGMRG